eukprot:CAMPEP_0201490110 /NCGR_PEP_ID=MMETSP0151_2-20130828/25090_1 /ASSEMBLY_ACC=CAM_ASM_000257 /TAXON_ID=200890 /ORGANISM="Paramoeba atlantica, Strain 621/1 / CCAP 1560/9" /LENGTH=38 /DNA_ID= /DNA_START= /DNA_END= /DNA_ORIENTATION=
MSSSVSSLRSDDDGEAPLSNKTRTASGKPSFAANIRGV